jgi:hypothetical protein
VARSSMRSATASFKQAGITLAEAKVGDADPVLAIDDELREGGPYKAVVISTFPAGISRWLKLDAVSRLRRQHPGLKVIHVISGETKADSQTRHRAERPTTVRRRDR